MYDINYLTDSFIIAVALSIDATVVSFTQGLIFQKNKRLASFTLAFFVGFFQFFMPLIGWIAASFIHSYVENIAKWIAFLIFLFLGIKIIFDATRKKEDTNCECAEQTPKLSLNFLLAVSVATSIDALGAGVSFNLLNKPIVFAAVLIGIITFINSLIGFWSGCCCRKINSKFLEIFAGIILIFLAIKNFQL